jgi:uncharacterized protein DUF6412
MARVRGLMVLLSLALVWLPQIGSMGDLLTVASVVAVGVAILLIWQPADPAPVVRVRARVLRERARRSAFLRTRDPDADGRVRPRAPGWGLAAV